MLIADYLNADINNILGVESVDSSYYLNEETAKIAQEVFENKDLRILFDASRNVKRKTLDLRQK